jgi:hypothetical protein
MVALSLAGCCQALNVSQTLPSRPPERLRQVIETAPSDLLAERLQNIEQLDLSALAITDTELTAYVAAMLRQAEEQNAGHSPSSVAIEFAPGIARVWIAFWRDRIWLAGAVTASTGDGSALLRVGEVRVNGIAVPAFLLNVAQDAAETALQDAVSSLPIRSVLFEEGQARISIAMPD